MPEPIRNTIDVEDLQRELEAARQTWTRSRRWPSPTGEGPGEAETDSLPHA